MKRYEVLILGVGAAGSMCALSAKGKNVAIIDAGSRVAKKLLVTGNGRCNLTNKNVNSSFYNTNVDAFFARFGNNDTLKFFEKLGLETHADEEGRVYPLANTAKSVVDVIENNIGGDTYLNEKVEKVSHEKGVFLVKTTKQAFAAEKIVLAIGGDCGWCLSDLGLKFSKFRPSLVALQSDETRDLNGVRLSNVKVTASTSNGQTKSEMGEVQFRENGISGIVVFNLSSLFARENNYAGKIEIDLLPQFTENEIVKKIQSRKKSKLNLDKLFVGMFHNAVANEIFKQSKLNTNRESNMLSDNEAQKLAHVIKFLRFSVYGACENNQIFAGGVDLKDLTENLESKTIKGLYVVGEAVNVDGVCGGYNLQWAWTSGHIVGEQI